MYVHLPFTWSTVYQISWGISFHIHKQVADLELWALPLSFFLSALLKQRRKRGTGRRKGPCLSLNEIHQHKVRVQGKEINTPERKASQLAETPFSFRVHIKRNFGISSEFPYPLSALFLANSNCKCHCYAYCIDDEPASPLCTCFFLSRLKYHPFSHNKEYFHLPHLIDMIKKTTKVSLVSGFSPSVQASTIFLQLDDIPLHTPHNFVFQRVWHKTV